MQAFMIRNIMYFATAEQQHHSVELSDKTMLVKSKVSFIHSTAVKKKKILLILSKIILKKKKK